MLKSIGSSLYQRVFVAYKTTLVSLGLVAADAVISTLDAAALPQWAHLVVGVAASVLALYKGKTPPVLPAPVP